ncbi:MAG: Gfo/Idh/MocA family oxidoreductase [Acidobacteria bacterium]|nr:Gfo/Idh/MocA family oxidoreductase [Acidobacteriota bacterium]
MENQTPRRSFLAASTAAFSIVAPQSVRGSQANSALSVGLIGCGNRGMYVSGIFARNEYAKVTKICDIYDDKLAAGRAKYSGAQEFKDIKELLASDVDAVLIATPIVYHPEHFELATKAKKHIYMEKAAAIDAKGCMRVLKAAKAADPTKRISMGFQQRYGKDYRHAHALINSGQLGKIRMIRAAWLGTGPAYKPNFTGQEEKIRNWYFYRDMSGDIITEQDCHNIDVLHWFTDKNPVKAAGYGTRAMRKEGDVLDSLSVTFQYADGLVASFSANQFGSGQAFQDVSETFMCDEGTVRTSRKGISVWRKGMKEAEEWPTTYDITIDAVNEFVEGSRTGKLENAAIWGAESTMAAVMAREAIYTGREVTWDKVSKG